MLFCAILILKTFPCFRTPKVLSIILLEPLTFFKLFEPAPLVYVASWRKVVRNVSFICLHFMSSVLFLDEFHDLGDDVTSSQAQSPLFRVIDGRHRLHVLKTLQSHAHFEHEIGDVPFRVYFALKSGVFPGVSQLLQVMFVVFVLFYFILFFFLFYLFLFIFIYFHFNYF